MSRVLLSLASLLLFLVTDAEAAEIQQVIRTAQEKVVKIYGAGGLRRMEAYQTGILISSEGHVLTALSYVLDTDDLAVILDDGRKSQAEFLASDPITELALLKIEVQQPLPHFELRRAANIQAGPGERILAISNLFGIATGDESASVLQGVITAIAPLQARRGSFQANYQEKIYVLDAYSNNPGAAGGALVNWQGRLLGILGKELKSEVTGTWLNYALPTSQFVDTVDDLLAGRTTNTLANLPAPEKPLSLAKLGILLIPDVLPRTPPYVDTILRDSPAERAGIRSDDLIVFVANDPVDSCRAVVDRIKKHDQEQEITISVLREGKLREFTLQVEAAPDNNPTNIDSKDP